MTNQSHTELAAQVRKLAEFLKAGHITQYNADKAVPMLLAYAAALESPERAQGQARLQQECDTITELNHAQWLALGKASLLVAACNRLSAESEEFDFDDGLGRGAQQAYWDEFESALEHAMEAMDVANKTTQRIHATPPTAPAQDARWWSPPDSFAKNWLTNGAALHPLTINLVVRFARALAAKLAAAEVKYGYSDGWRSADWMDECRAKLAEHVAKGDPRDVAAYCAFLWHHGESTAATPSTQSSEGGTEVSALKAYLKECDECCIVPDVGGAFAYAWRAALRASSPADTRNALRADHPLARGQCIHNVPMSEHCGACSPKEPQPGAIISGYTITEGFDGVKVERAQQMEGPAKWAVRRSGNVLSRSGEWDWEPTPSSRTHEWLSEHRFDTASEAIDAAHGIVTKEST